MGLQAEKEPHVAEGAKLYETAEFSQQLKESRQVSHALIAIYSKTKFLDCFLQTSSLPCRSTWDASAS